MYGKRLIAIPALVSTIAAAFIGGGAASAVEPSFASPEIGMHVLDMMCAEQGGQAYNTPYTISRCQEAQSRPGFEIEELVCEGLLGGTFNSVPSIGRNKHTNWACVPGPI